MDALTHFVAWAGSTPLAHWAGASTNRVAWLFTTHVFGLVLLLGGMIFLSLRMLNLVLPQLPVRSMARAVLPVSTAGLLIMLASGYTIFSGGAVAYFAGPWFRLKMVLLAVAILFHIFVFRRVALADDGRFGRITYGVVGLAALLIWFSVAWSGRLIAFF